MVYFQSYMDFIVSPGVILHIFSDQKPNMGLFAYN